MEFSSLYFLYLFLPLTLLVYFLVPGLRLKNIVLLAASLLFYAMGQPVYVLLLVGLSMRTSPWPGGSVRGSAIRSSCRSSSIWRCWACSNIWTSSSASSASPSRTAA